MKRVRQAKVTVIGANGSEFTTVIRVADDWKPPVFSNEDDWIEIQGADGDYLIVPPQRVVGIFVGAATDAAKGGRIN